MLFNSFTFLFLFLPFTLAGFYLASAWRHTAGQVFLIVLSLAFYSYWRVIYLPLLLASILFNWLIGGRINAERARGREARMRAWLALGLVADIAALGWFKYANFVVDNVNVAMGSHFYLDRIALPLAISFFTFQKIAYIVDCARGQAGRIGLLEFSLFASFFPQLIAGPIVHYKEAVPQFRRSGFGRLNWDNLLIGLVILVIGLCKKTLIADALAPEVARLFDSGQVTTPGFSEAWLGAVLFSVQLYFDFSGYSDMAIGLARMFGILLPLNFHSPYRATNIIDYWRRWHMTLQRFIVTYLYQPLALPLSRIAARKGLGVWGSFALAVAFPTVLTFLIVGLWHGAGWTFVLFGLMHGVYISANEAWRERQKQTRRARRKAGLPAAVEWPGARALSTALLLFCVLVSDVAFRANSLEQAGRFWRAMAGWGAGGAGVGLAPDLLATLLVGMGLILLAPNTQQIMGRFTPALNWPEWRTVSSAPVSWRWVPSTGGLLMAGLALFFGIMFIQRGQAVFLYFNF